MHIQTIRSIARQLGVSPGKSTKADLIRNIQRNEGNFDCFGSATAGYCDQPLCSWREDCLPVAGSNKRTPASTKASKRPKA